MFPDITQSPIALIATIIIYIIWRKQKNNDLLWLISAGILSAFGSFAVYLTAEYFIFLLKQGNYTAMVMINNYDLPYIFAIVDVAFTPLVVFILMLIIIVGKRLIKTKLHKGFF